MDRPKFENVKNELCVICGIHIKGGGEKWLCIKCLKPCDITYNLVEKINEKNSLAEAKSKCCNSDVRVASRITCGKDCHEKFVELMEKDAGKFKMVTCMETGISYRVPTRDIIEKGLKVEDLEKYPVWIQNGDKKW